MVGRDSGASPRAPAREAERVECKAICSLDGAPADTELPGNIDTGVFCYTPHDEREPAKYVEASLNVCGFFDQQSKALS